MSCHAALRSGVRSVFSWTEEAFDGIFRAADNPLRHLGAIGLYLLWIVVGSGIYLYIVLDTGIEAVYRSIDYLSLEQWWFGGVLRSLHRYAADGFVLVMMLHLVREWCYGRYYGFRLYSWMTGVPLIWLVYIAGIGGYWIVWDQLAQVSAIATTELLDWLPIFNDPSARNFVAPDAISDRFFTVLVFIHLGVPLLLILGLWAHVHRISHVDYLPSRRAMLATLAALLILSLLLPATSRPPANLAIVPGEIEFDWLILFLHPLADASSPAIVWTLLFGGTVLLFALPLLPHPPRQPAAIVDPANCTGCGRCLADCPFAAISVGDHPLRHHAGRGSDAVTAALAEQGPATTRYSSFSSPRHGSPGRDLLPAGRIAVVDADLCASCGICAGSCPSATPFRRQQVLINGIDMPQQPVDALRQQLEEALAALAGDTRIVVFSCANGADSRALVAPDTAVLPLLCIGLLPPAFVEYALRGGADGVLIAACRTGGCEFRLGERWLGERLRDKREPHLRKTVPASRWHLTGASAREAKALADALSHFRHHLEGLPRTEDRLPPYSRRPVHHA